MDIRSVIFLVVSGITLVFAVAVLICFAGMQRRLESAETALEDAQADNAWIRSELERLRDELARREQADRVFIEQTEKAAESHAEKIKIIQTDDDACKWLDDVLPASVRDTIGACAGNKDNHAASLSDDRLRKAEDIKNGDQSGSDYVCL